MDISLNRELENYVAAKIAAGQYASPTEVVSGVLELLRTQETWTDADVAELRKEIGIGINQLDRGEGSPWSVDEIRAEGQKLLNRKKP